MKNLFDPQNHPKALGYVLTLVLTEITQGNREDSDCCVVTNFFPVPIVNLIFAHVSRILEKYHDF